MKTLIKWPDIQLFNNVYKFIKINPNNWFSDIVDKTKSTSVIYRSKCKLHGMNMAIQVYDNNVICQSRDTILSLSNDLKGFAKFVSERDFSLAKDHIIYGEWVGPGIQSDVAVSNIPNKVFAVFAASPLNDLNKLIIEPDELSNLVSNIKDVYVIPWYNELIEINWSNSEEEIGHTVMMINEWVKKVEENDPWVFETFNIKGTGEGLVFYPISHPGREMFSNFTFKAKGNKHQNIAKAAPAQLHAEKANSINEFVNLVVTEARLNQGLALIGNDKKFTGKFVQWVKDDVKKEAKDEMEASGLTFDIVQKEIENKARTWFLKGIN